MSKLILVGIIGILTFPINADEVKLSTDAWCPYSCDPGSDKQGILVDVAMKIFNKAGHTVNYKSMNWARAIVLVRTGKHDGLIDAYKSDAPDFIFPEESVMISKMCFFSKQEDPWEFKGYDSLKGRKISVSKGYSYGKEFDAYIEKNKGKSNSTINTIHGMDLIKRRMWQMSRGQIDTILEDWSVFSHQVKPYKKFKGVKNAGCLPEEELYIAFSPNKNSSQNYADLISEGLREMKASGELEAIIDKYK